MPIPAAAIAIGSILLTNIARVIGVQALRAAFVSGGLRGLGKALVVKAVQWGVSYFTISRITQYAISARKFLVNFNWNISDRQIDEQINASFTALGSILGSAVGTTLGSLTCSTGMLIINPSAMAYIDDIGEEVWEEIYGAWASVFNAGIRLVTQTLFLKGYKSLRNWLKTSGLAARYLGQEKAEAWGKSTTIVSIAKSWESTVEAIPNPFIRGFIAEMVEEGWEACDEFAMLVANRADQALGAMRSGLRDRVLGDETILEIYPNRDNRSEFTVLAGREEIVRAQAVQVLAQNQLMANRDVGVICVPDNFTYTEQSMRRAPREISCKFEFVAHKEAPYYRPINNGGPDQNKILRVQIDVGNISRTKLDWQTLKLAAGGTNGYMYGQNKCVMYLTNAQNQNMGSITVWASTFDAAKDRCEAMRLLQNDTEIKNIDGGIEKEGGRRSTQKGNMKPIIQIYPYRVIITIGMDIAARNLGRQKLNSATGQQIQRRAVINLAQNTPPSDFNERINDLFVLVTQG